MNRRGFIATLAALAGVALAKIKAPVANVVRRRHGRILALAGEQIRAGDAVYIKDGKMYKCPTGQKRG